MTDPNADVSSQESFPGISRKVFIHTTPALFAITLAVSYACRLLFETGFPVESSAASPASGMSIPEMLLVSLSVAVFGGAFAAWHAWRTFGKPLARIADASQNLAEGDFVPPSLPDGDGDLGRLSRNIEQAALSLSAIAAGAISLSRTGVSSQIAAGSLSGAYRQVANEINLALAFMENVNSLVYIVDMDTCEFIYCNKKMRGDYGSDRLLTKGVRCWEVIGENRGEGRCGYCRISELKASEEEIPHAEFEVFIPRTRCWHLVRNSVVRWFDGRKVLFAEASDITARKLYEEGLKKNEVEHARAADAARQASQLKTNFLANMSHEIRTPMNGILGFAELAMAEPSIPSRTREYLRKIHFSADGLLHILDDILDLSKIETGIRKVDCVPFRLADVIEYCRMVNSPRAQEKGLDLFVQSDPGLDVELYGDPAKLRQALLNLLSNAVKFTEKGMVKLQCTREAETADRLTLRFEVSDSGIGIPRDHLPHVFDAFTQADSGATRQYGGAGLGLAITKKNVEAMGGDLKVVSTPGIGSKFVFIIGFDLVPPERSAVANPDETVPASPDASSDTWYFNKHSGQAPADDTGYWPTPVFTDLVERPAFVGEVLVCEDNELNTEVIVEQLNRVGIKPVVAVNGLEGVDVVRQRVAENRQFDLVLMDIQMPVMGGLEAAARMRELGLTAPVVALTANVMKSARETYRRAGLAGCLGKPFTTAELWACLRAHLKEDSPRSAESDRAGDDAVLRSLSALAPGILDVSAGLEHAAGNAKLYLRLLCNFRKDNRDTMEKLAEALRKGDRELSRRIAHTLKGTSGMIGAPALRASAAELEAAIAAGRSGPEFLVDTERHMRRLLDALADVPLSRGATAAPVKKPFDPDKASEFIRRLRPLLDDADAEALTLLDAVKDVLGPFGPAGGRLAEQMENYDFEEAAATLASIESALYAGRNR